MTRGCPVWCFPHGVFVFAMCLPLAILAGCGGGAPAAGVSSVARSAGSASRPALTRAEYTSRANSVCRAAARSAPAFPGKKSGGGYQTTASAVLPYLHALLAINRTSVAGMQRLHPPDVQSRDHKRLMAAHRARVEDLQAALAAATRGDGAGFTAAFQRDQKQTEPRYTRAALQLGLTACAGG